jgi:hypothetical protein
MSADGTKLLLATRRGSKRMDRYEHRRVILSAGCGSLKPIAQT